MGDFETEYVLTFYIMPLMLKSSFIWSLSLQHLLGQMCLLGCAVQYSLN